MALQPQQFVIVKLQAYQWQQVLEALDAAPHRIARPLIDAIVAQIQAEDPPPSAEVAPAGRGANGAGTHVQD